MILDDIDRRIVAALVSDGRMSARALSRELPISEGTARLRLKRLLDAGVSVRALINPGKIGFPTVAVLGFRVALSDLGKVVAQLAVHERVAYVTQVTGDFEVFALMVFNSSQDLTSVLQDFGRHITGVQGVQVNICLETKLGYLASLTADSLRSIKEERVGIDRIDFKMIECLVVDGRVTVRDLGKMMSISEVTARRRLKRLIDSKTIAITALVDPDQIGFPVVAIVGLKVAWPRIRDIAATLATHRQLNYVTTCAGRFDIVATGMFRSTRDLNVFLQDFISRIKGVNATQTFICMDNERGFFSKLVPRVAPEF